MEGRKDRLRTIRKAKGLAPFPKREESVYDTFNVCQRSAKFPTYSINIEARLAGICRSHASGPHHAATV